MLKSLHNLETVCGAGSEKQVKSNAKCEAIRMVLMTTKYITGV